MKIRLIGGHSNGKILEIPSDRLGYPIFIPISPTRIPEPEPLVFADRFENEAYVIEALRVNKTLFHFGRSTELTIEQAIYLLLLGESEP